MSSPETNPGSPPPNPLEFVRRQVSILEALFGADWFNNPSAATLSHPAYRRWLTCKDIVSRGGILRVPEQLRPFAEISLDNALYILCSHGNVQSFKLDDMSNYGHPDVVKRVRAMIATSNGFSSIMTELCYAAWNLSYKRKVTAHWVPGVADFEVVVSELSLPLVAECKHLGRETSRDRIVTDLRDANGQVKALQKECFGLAVIDVSEQVSSPTRWTAEIPADVTDFVRRTKSCLVRRNTSLSGALIVWSDFFVEPIPGQPRWHVCFRRRCQVVHHANPIKPLPSDTTPLEIGFTSEFILS
jgi:hypothetical protein